MCLPLDSESCLSLINVEQVVCIATTATDFFFFRCFLLKCGLHSNWSHLNIILVLEIFEVIQGGFGV